jgi:hypothetical protein
MFHGDLRASQVAGQVFLSTGIQSRTGAPESRSVKFGIPARYSIFDSGLYRILEAMGLFPQEKATLHALKMSKCESKVL